MAHALMLNKKQHASFVIKNLRRSNAFEIHSVDDMEQYVREPGGSFRMS